MDTSKEDLSWSYHALLDTVDVNLSCVACPNGLHSKSLHLKVHDCDAYEVVRLLDDFANQQHRHHPTQRTSTRQPEQRISYQ